MTFSQGAFLVFILLATGKYYFLLKFFETYKNGDREKWMIYIPVIGFFFCTPWQIRYKRRFMTWQLFCQYVLQYIIWFVI